jgi:hypothetical protein
MPELNELSIFRVDSLRVPDAKKQDFHITSQQGYLHSSYFIDEEEYRIRMYRTYRDKVRDYKGKGYGKELLRVGRDHAISLGAQVITSTLICSRESVEAMASVFGRESLDITMLGDFAPRFADTSLTSFTRAYLRYPLPSPEENL